MSEYSILSLSPFFSFFPFVIIRLWLRRAVRHAGSHHPPSLVTRQATISSLLLHPTFTAGQA